MTRTLTPRRAARTNARRNALSGRKYGVWMSMLVTAPSISIWKTTREAVARSDGELLTSIASAAPAVRQRRPVSRRRQDLAAAFQPVLGEDALQRRHDRPLDARHRVAPRRLAVVRLQPPVGDAGAAGERDAAVDDQQLAVGPVVQAVQPVPA